MLTSPQNSTIQTVRALQAKASARQQAGAFVIEGLRLAEEALAAGLKPEILLHIPDLAARGQHILEGFRTLGVQPILVAEHVMRAASDTQTPQGLLAVFPIQPLPVPPAPTLVLIPDGVRDPGNLGALLRACAAAGAHAVLLPPGTVDPYAPKVVRAGMGAHFHVPLHHLPWAEIAAFLARHHLHAFLADAQAPLPYTRADLRLPLALLIGSEAHGAGEEARALRPTGLQIPMPGHAESLNAALAAGIILFEAVRQRGEEGER